MKKTTILSVFFIFVFSSVFSQEYTGKVIDSKSKKPLEGVSIYFDGTTLGTITNTKGVFSIETKQSTESALVISFLGYKTKILSKRDLKVKDLVINLEVEPMSLEEVLIEEDNWSREKKWKYFKREFLGRTQASEYCNFLNPKDVRLVYVKSENKLYASSRKPIIIANKYLGYRIAYNLIDFEIFFKGSEKYISVNRVYYSGTSQFKEINEKRIKKKYLKKREKTYDGSFLHFMRSLATASLAENKFQIFVKDSSGKSKLFFGIAPQAVFKVEKLNDYSTEVIINRQGKITITHNGFTQSSITLEDKTTRFNIDGFGNYYPIYKLLVGGEFGKNRMSTMLPSNYGLDSN